MKKQKYNLIYSLGADCACSMYMRDNCLRLSSGPFDWLTHADFETRINYILNDFEGFLNIEDLEFLEKDPTMFNDKHCDYYQNKKDGFYFFHEFPTGVPIEESFAQVKEKYDRRIKRFYEQINKNEKVLLIWLSHEFQTPDSKVLELCNKVCEKFGKKIDFLIIENDSSKSKEEVETYKLYENITRYKLLTIDDSIESDPTCGRIKVINKIFSNYELDIPFDKKIVLKSKLYKNKLKGIIKNIFSIRNHYIGNKKYKALVVLGCRIVLKCKKM